jgi:hypothetical protein
MAPWAAGRGTPCAGPRAFRPKASETPVLYGSAHRSGIGPSRPEGSACTRSLTLDVYAHALLDDAREMTSETAHATTVSQGNAPVPSG